MSADELEGLGLVEDFTIRIIDVAERARLLYGDNAEYVVGQPLPEHDYRFEVIFGNGSRASYPRGPVPADWIVRDRDRKTGEPR